MIETWRICSACNEERPDNASHFPPGRNECHECRREKAREQRRKYYQANREKELARRREYVKKNSDKEREYQREYQRRYREKQKAAE